MAYAYSCSRIASHSLPTLPFGAGQGPREPGPKSISRSPGSASGSTCTRGSASPLSELDAAPQAPDALSRHESTPPSTAPAPPCAPRLPRRPCPRGPQHTLTCMHACTHKHMLTHTFAHARTHTHTHTHMGGDSSEELGRLHSPRPRAVCETLKSFRMPDPCLPPPRNRIWGGGRRERQRET